MDDCPIRVLLVEDDEDDYFLTRELLSEISADAYKLDRVATYDAGLEAMRQNWHDVYLLDYRLERRTGVELLRAAVSQGCNGPIILLTGQGERAVDMEAMKAGAADFLMKGRLDAPLLERSIRYAIERKRAEAELRQMKAELEVGVQKRTAELAQANDALRQSKQQLQFVTENAPVLLAHCDQETRFKFVNKGYAERFEVESHAVVGKRMEDVLGEAAYQTFRPYVDAVLSGQEVKFEAEIPYERIGSHYMLCAFAPEIDASGEVVGFVAVSQNISDRKRAEEALKDADRRKDEFLAMLAHELRNPLAPIRNALHILQLPGLDAATVKRAREMMDRQVQHMVRLVDDLLDVSRIMRGKIELRREPVELCTVIARAVETSQPSIDAQGHVLSVTLPPEPIWLEADLVRLAQVIANLLNNAAKYTERAGRICLIAERQGGEMVVRVRDNGIGVAAEFLPHMFDLFMQAERSIARSQGGLGIGLTLVRRLVELHGGSVSVTSEGLGKGSEFIIRLPVLDHPGRSRAAQQVQDIVPDGSDRRMKVLVVDDNKDAAESVALIVRFWKHEVRVLHDGPSALELVHRERPDAILLDIGLPGMNGYEVARTLREKPEFADMLLIAITGYGLEADRRDSAEAGFNHHLTKPADPGILQRLLAQAEREKAEAS